MTLIGDGEFVIAYFAIHQADEPPCLRTATTYTMLDLPSADGRHSMVNP
jgi:hypothetical protein